MTSQMGKPVVEPYTTAEVRIPTEKIVCIFITERLQKYLEEYPPSSGKQAFLDLYHMLSLPDQYLYNNPRQHIHCTSHNKEYVILLNHATNLCIDISKFSTVWAVLFILLDTQDNKLCKSKYAKFLQEEYNRYYEYRTREYMKK